MPFADDFEHRLIIIPADVAQEQPAIKPLQLG
jgi:hypothetical protein